MAFIVVYDACVLHPAALRDLLIRMAGIGTFRARWTERILDECVRSVIERGQAKPDAMARTRTLMTRAVDDCLITGYEELIDGLELPDPDDRHVLAAAIRAGAQAIITFNLKDFPESTLAAYSIEPKHPDDFVLETIDLAPGAVTQVITEQVADLKSPPSSIGAVLDTLRAQGLVQSVARLRELFARSGI